MKKKVLLGILITLAALLTAYIVASCLAVNTMSADSANASVWSYKKSEDEIRMKVWIGVSGYVLTGYSYQISGDTIEIQVKEAHIWTAFFTLFGKSAELDIRIPIDPDVEYTIYFTDGENRVEAELPQTNS